MVSDYHHHVPCCLHRRGENESASTSPKKLFVCLYVRLSTNFELAIMCVFKASLVRPCLVVS